MKYTLKTTDYVIRFDMDSTDDVADLRTKTPLIHNPYLPNGTKETLPQLVAMNGRLWHAVFHAPGSHDGCGYDKGVWILRMLTLEAA